jgi:predicted RNA-binding protein with PUA-like domain
MGGIRSYQSRNFLREMRRGEQAIFYHSNAKPPGVAGICKIVKAAEMCSLVTLCRSACRWPLQASRSSGGDP